MESNNKNKKQAPLESISESLDIKSIPAIRAPRHYLTEEDLVSLTQKEAAVKKKIGNLIDSMLCDDSKISEVSEMDNTKNKTEVFDISEFV